MIESNIPTPDQIEAAWHTLRTGIPHDRDNPPLVVLRRVIAAGNARAEAAEAKVKRLEAQLAWMWHDATCLKCWDSEHPCQPNERCDEGRRLEAAAEGDCGTLTPAGEKALAKDTAELRQPSGQ